MENVDTTLMFLLPVLLHLYSTSFSLNIVFIVASWHNPNIPTPQLAKLAKAGLLLEQNYVQPICTPTR